jgi:hypothetical protein
MIRRREFITLLGGAAAAWPLKVNAEQAIVRPLIGLLSPITPADAKPFITAFRAALRDLGYVEGRNMTMAIRYAEGSPDRMPQLARERAVGVAVEVIKVRDISNVAVMAAEIERANVNGLFVGQAPFYLVARSEITAIATRLKLPTIYGFRQYAEAGGLMTYGPSLIEIYRQSARLADRIIKGTKPSELPFELPTRYELIVNLKAAKAIGLVMPDSFVLLADEVIE